MGIDLGSARVGVALSDGSGTIASPHSVLKRKGKSDEYLHELKSIVKEWEVELIVVGLPLSLDGSMGPAAKSALHESKRMGVVTGVPIETYDERLTTVSAHHVLREQGVAGPDRKAVVDKIAASILLQSWLDGRNSTSDAYDKG
ncbi:MAG: Holliday junction resolvase RuvX [Acidimicrobiales bacterium]